MPEKHELTEVERLKVENCNLKLASLKDRQSLLYAQLAALQEEVRERLGFPKGTKLVMDQETYTVIAVEEGEKNG